jgi:polysaccharide pyruvyl transferase WcaK-like protein
MNPEDRAMCDSILEHLNENERGLVDVLETETLTPSKVQGAIANLEVLIGMRLHPLIFAYNTHTPFVALEYAPKVRMFCERIGRQSALVSLERDDWADAAVANYDEQMQCPAEDVPASHSASSLDRAYARFLDWLGEVCEG